MHPLAKLDHRYIWHPFTQMRDWLKTEPILIVEGQGALLRDVHGREYLDANSSIWTNLHGHRHARINAAIQRQLGKIAHSSALGFANEPASLLAGQLVQAANPSWLRRAAARRLPPPAGARLAPARPSSRPPHLQKVFFSDDGSTALEVALKLTYEFSRRTGRSQKPRFVSLEGAYHGDTVGAVALGHIDLFHKAYAGLLFKIDQVRAPYCYRCPFNRARPERTDARDYRRCRWECLGQLEKQFAAKKKQGNPYAAFAFEPLMQGSAGMIAQPAGWLRQATAIARGYGAQLIADEVMTGCGRTGFNPSGFLPSPAGTRSTASPSSLAPSDGERAGVRGSLSTLNSQLSTPPLFACHQEGVQPDFLALAKGLTGGYLPMAATLTTSAVFEAFLGEYEEFKTFFHGHSFTGNQLGAAAALASLELLQSPEGIHARQQLQETLREELQKLWSLPRVGDIRQVGLVAGVELVRDWRTRAPFEMRERAGIRVCQAMARRGVLTRPIGSVVVLMPPYCTTRDQVRKMIAALRASIAEL